MPTNTGAPLKDAIVGWSISKWNTNIWAV